MTAKPPLVLIHGLIGSLAYFEPQRRFRRAEAFCCDLLGYGRLRYARTETLTLAGQAGHVAAYVESLGRGPVWLMGHSMGGAVVLLAADRRPQLVAGIINVEGNFTPKDAFWSSRIIAKSPEEWSADFAAMAAAPEAAVRRWSIEPTPQRVAWMRQIIANQPAETLYAMSAALVVETREASYLQAVRRIMQRTAPVHLLAGERSAVDWDIPPFVRAAAASYTEQRGAGHLMMLEAPDDFCGIVDGIVGLGSERI